ATQYTVAVGIHYQLHEGALLGLRETQLHGPKTAFEDFHAVLFTRLLLGKTHRTDIWQAKHCGRYELIAQRAVLLRPEQATRHRRAFCQRHWRQLHTADHVADGQNVGVRGAVQVVDPDEAPIILLDTRILQPQVVQHRPAPG